MKNLQKGFTLIELMIVVAIIAILAAIALPAYQNYTVRSKVSELVVAADACKTSVAEYYQSQGTFPPSMNSSGCLNQQSKYVTSLSVGAGTGVISVTASADPGLTTAVQGKVFGLTPAAQGAGLPLLWTCNTAPTSIPAQYLPATCR
ncbi:pilin [Dyella agri]|uniref:Pilin n=1 Tax=Dyella agri TaxID=1926869 RepID=A0ABW8KBS1_9GAMM